MPVYELKPVGVGNHPSVCVFVSSVLAASCSRYLSTRASYGWVSCVLADVGWQFVCHLDHSGSLTHAPSGASRALALILARMLVRLLVSMLLR